MKKAIIAKKIGMTQVFSESGEIVPVTVLEAGTCVVTQIKTVATDGYDAVQIGFGTLKENKVTKPIKGHFEKAGAAPMKTLKEFRLEEVASYKVGDEIKADVFTPGDRVDISGVSKGKGFQGTIKRHNQSRGPMAHGSKYHRAVGSLGASSDPSRVFKGKKMPGHMGNENVTVQNIAVVKSDADKNLILVKGGVPGSNGTICFITDSVKA